MSTEISEIKGIKESTLNPRKTVDTNMCLTRFYGGSNNGSMIQLTINNGDGYIQFTESEVIDLAKVLLNSFNRDIYPSD